MARKTRTRITYGPRQGRDQDSIVDSSINSPTPGLPSIIPVVKGARKALRGSRAKTIPPDPRERVEPFGTL